MNPYHHLEQIHAQISALLEIFSPFEKSDFKDIYQSLLPYKEASFGILASGMSCFTGIINAGPKKPNILYGENTYYECIKVMQKFAASSKLFDEASTQEIKNVDLLALQFNPSLRTDPNIKEYKREDVHGIINKCLRIKNGSPFTVILDSTFDAIQSQIVNGLIQEFEKEIRRGSLNIICFRSGNKYDLFGMDNYYGAPFFMVNNQDVHWASFQALFTDPILQCDRLSMNWFCLAYKYAAKELQLYQRLIFENTRAFLDDIPEKLLSPTARYRVIPMQEGVDPPFIDIKVTGPLHRMKGCALVAGSLYLSSMEGGYPIFSRPSLGFYHPNFTMIFDEKVTTIRLTLGLDPAHINVLSGWMKTLEKL